MNRHFIVPALQRIAGVALLGLLGAAVPLICGCSFQSTRSAPLLDFEVFKDTDPGYIRKKVGVVPFGSETLYGSELAGELFQDYVVRAQAEECSNVWFLTPDTPDFPEELTRLPLLADGSPDNYNLAMMGRKAGFNAMLFGSVLGVGTEEKKWGFWPFKQTRYYIKVDLLLEVYDTESAAKILDRTVSRSMRIDEFDMEMIESQKNVDITYVEEILEELAPSLADSVCGAVEDQPWKSYLLSVEGDKVLIASGRSSGLKPELILHVYDSDRLIEGLGKRRYAMPGRKVAEIELETVFIDRARGRIVSGSDLKPGYMVKMK